MLGLRGKEIATGRKAPTTLANYVVSTSHNTIANKKDKCIRGASRTIVVEARVGA